MIIDSASITYSNVALTLTDNSKIVGKINISPKKRVSDFMNDHKQFITLIESQSDEFNEKIIFINKAYIITCEPLE